MAGGGFIAITYSRGHGSLAAKGALIAAVMVLAERALNHLKRRPALDGRKRAFYNLAWGLYKRPLLLAGWIASVTIIILSLVRNLILLGGGEFNKPGRRQVCSSSRRCTHSLHVCSRRHALYGSQ
jgi:hypothetical protein